VVHVAANSPDHRVELLRMRGMRASSLDDWVSRAEHGQPCVIGKVELAREDGCRDGSSVDAHASSTMRLRTIFLVTEHAALSRPKRFGNCLQVLDDRGRRGVERLIARVFVELLLLTTTRPHGLDTLIDVVLVVGDYLVRHRVISPRAATKFFTSSRCRLIDSRIHSLTLQSGRETSSETFGAPSALLSKILRTARFDHHDRDVSSTSRSAAFRDTSSNVAASPSWYVGCGAHSPSCVAMRTRRSVLEDARDHQRGRCPLIASTSTVLLVALKIVPTTGPRCESLRKDVAASVEKTGETALSGSLAAEERGILPARSRSSMSTVAGKSLPSRTLLARDGPATWCRVQPDVLRRPVGQWPASKLKVFSVPLWATTRCASLVVLLYVSKHSAGSVGNLRETRLSPLAPRTGCVEHVAAHVPFASRIARRPSKA